MKKFVIAVMTIALIGTMAMGAYAGKGRGRGAGPGDGTGTGNCKGSYCDKDCPRTPPRDGSGNQHGRR